jgi:hypothetical protein
MRSGNNMGKKENYREPDDNLNPEDQEEQFDELNPEDEFDEFERDHVPTRKEIAEQDRYLLRRQQEFRLAADAIVVAFSRFPEVEAISMFGSVAVPLRKEIPRFREYRRNRIEVWHECGDVDFAVWLSALDNLRELERARSRAMNDLLETTGIGVAHHQVDVLILEPGTDRYLGWLCTFAQCPKPHKLECMVPDCGSSPFLRQFQNFKLYETALSKSVPLFDRRRGGLVQRAAQLPLSGIE